MQIFVKIKQASKRRLVIEKQPIDIANIGNAPTLRALISAVVTQQVAAFNAKMLDAPILFFLTDHQIKDAAATGKVGFGAIHTEGKADLHKSIKVAVDAHNDGLFVVAVNDIIIEELDDFVVLNQDAVVTFIRLTLLIGR